MKKPASVNDPFGKMSNAELQENLEWWIERSKEAPQNGAAGQAADKFVFEIKREMEKRK